MSEVMNVPNGWKEESFSKIANVNMGQSPDSEYVNENQDGIPFLQGNGEFGDINPKELFWVTKPKKLAKKHDILISVRAPVGDMNIADKDYCIGRGLSALTINKIDPSYGFYALFHERKQLDRLAQGSTFSAIGKNDFDKLVIKFPKENKEQQKIAKILSTLDKTIEATQKLIDKEKNIKKGLMYDLLTNGIDSNGKIRTPQTHTYKQSELGLIPEEWEVLSLEKAISKVIDFRGKTPLKIGMDWGNGLIPSLSANNVQMGKIDFSKENHLGSEELYNVWMNKGATQKDDILFTMEAPLGNVALMPDDNKYILSQRVILLRSGNKIISHYMYHYMMGDDFQTRMLRYSSGSTVEGIQYSQLKEILIAFPKDSNEQKQTAIILNTQVKKIQTEEINLSKLKELKKGLMIDLLSGKVRVKV